MLTDWLYNMAEINYAPDPRDGLTPASRAFDCCDACIGPDAPGDVEALAAGALVMDVSWTDNSDDETGFDIRWRNITTGGDFVDAPSEPANATTATVSTAGGATDGDTIEVQVRAAGADCSSEWVSDTVVITDIN